MIKNKITSILFIFLRPISQAKLFCVIVIHNKTKQTKECNISKKLTLLFNIIRTSREYICAIAHEFLIDITLTLQLQI